MRVRTTSSRRAPAFSSAAAMFFSVCRVCARGVADADDRCRRPPSPSCPPRARARRRAPRGSSRRSVPTGRRTRCFDAQACRLNRALTAESRQRDPPAFDEHVLDLRLRPEQIAVGHDQIGASGPSRSRPASTATPAIVAASSVSALNRRVRAQAALKRRFARSAGSPSRPSGRADPKPNGTPPQPAARRRPCGVRASCTSSSGSSASGASVLGRSG